MKFILAFLIMSFAYPQNDINPIGQYKMQIKVGGGKMQITTLVIKKNGFEKNAEIPFKGSSQEKGTWKIKGDTITLTTETRKDKYTSKDRYNTNNQKQSYEYHRVEKFKVYEEKLCALDAASEFAQCFEKGK